MSTAPGPEGRLGNREAAIADRKKPAPKDSALRGAGSGFRTALYQKISCSSSGMLRITST